ncbi:MAG: iron ABC transporter permease [Alphaproteobacteria bacterium]|nr:iron ABC transporter permease [Alphaproteobacteria bacterium]
MAIAVERAGERAGWRPDLSVAVLALLGLFLCGLVLLPLGWLAWYSVTDANGVPTLANFVRLATDPSFAGPYLTALEIAAAVALAACAAATPLAWLVARTDLPLRRTIRMLVTASFVTPPFLGAIAWELLAAPNSGILNQWYRSLFGLDTYDHLFDIYTVAGLVFTMACYTFPYVFVLVANALDNIPGELEDASAILGGTAARTLRRVTLPMVLPALLAGGLVAFVQTLTQFGAPAILALPAGFHVITTKIWSLFQYPPNLHLAAAAAMPLLLLTVLMLRGQQLLLGRRGYTVLGGKSGAPRRLALGRWRWPALAFAGAIVALPVLLPYGALIKTALVGTPSDPLTLSNLTLHNIRFVFVDFSQTRQALWNTVLLGVGAATAGTFLALVVSYVTTRRVVPGHRVLGFLATAPVAIPGIVLGVGLFLAYTRPPLVLYGTLWILLLAFLTIEMPAGYQQMHAAFRGLHPELEEASRIFGASRLKSLWQVTAPLLRTSVVATWCFVFIGVIRELSATILLTTAQTKVVSVVIYDLNESGDLGAISVLGIALLLITFAVVALANRLPVLGRVPTPPRT